MPRQHSPKAGHQTLTHSLNQDHRPSSAASCKASLHHFLVCLDDLKKLSKKPQNLERGERKECLIGMIISTTHCSFYVGLPDAVNFWQYSFDLCIGRRRVQFLQFFFDTAFLPVKFIEEFINCSFSLSIGQLMAVSVGTSRPVGGGGLGSQSIN